MYIFGMCDCPFKVRSIHLFGAMKGLVAMGLGGWVACRIGLGCVAAPLEVVSADIHSPAPIPKEGGPLSSVTLSGRLE